VPSLIPGSSFPVAAENCIEINSTVCRRPDSELWRKLWPFLWTNSLGMANAEIKGIPVLEPNYRIIHIIDLPSRASIAEQRLGFVHCTARQCSAAPHYVIFIDVWRCGRLHVRRQHLCPRHAVSWCTTHHIAIAEVPTIAFWDARDTSRPTPWWAPEQLPVLQL